MNATNKNGTQNNYLTDYLNSAPISLALIRAIECKIMSALPFAHPILDLGCGDGLFSNILFKNRDYIDAAIDTSEAEVELAYKKTVYHEIKVADANDIPYADESFKFVMANDLFHHLQAPAAAISEAGRVLMPGGLLCFTVPTFIPAFHIRAFTSLMQSKFIQSFSPLDIIKFFNHDIKTYFRLKSIFTFKNWVTTLENAGFKVIFHKKYASFSTIVIQLITSFYLYRGLAYKKMLGRYIPFPSFHKKIITPITSRLFESLYENDSYEGENYLILAKKCF